MATEIELQTTIDALATRLADLLDEHRETPRLLEQARGIATRLEAENARLIEAIGDVRGVVELMRGERFCGCNRAWHEGQEYAADVVAFKLRGVKDLA